MYSVELGFNSKSSSYRIKKAMKVANEIGFKVDEDEKNLIIVTSNELNNKIIELLTLIGHLSKTYLKIDNENVEEIPEFIEIIKCKRRNNCKGKCFIQKTVNGGIKEWEWNKVFQLIGFIKKTWDYCDFNEWTFRFIQDPNLIIEESDEEIIIDKVILFDIYNDSRKLLRKYCPKFNDEEIVRKFNSLPEKIIIKKSEFKHADAYANEEDVDIEDSFNEEEEGDVSHNEDDVNHMDVLIKKFGDEVEERLRKVLKEFKNN